MMARVGRLAGALLAETGGEFFLVGNTRAVRLRGRGFRVAG